MTCARFLNRRIPGLKLFAFNLCTEFLTFDLRQIPESEYPGSFGSSPGDVKRRRQHYTHLLQRLRRLSRLTFTLQDLAHLLGSQCSWLEVSWKIWLTTHSGFLDTPQHLYNSSCLSVCPSVPPSPVTVS